LKVVQVLGTFARTEFGPHVVMLKKAKPEHLKVFFPSKEKLQHAKVLEAIANVACNFWPKWGKLSHYSASI